MSKLSYIALFSCLLSLILFSCSKNESEAGEYDNWQARNLVYVDSIARLAQQGTDKWTRALVYYFPKEYADANPGNNNIYVYVQKLQAGFVTVKPLYSDSVRVFYRGRLIPSRSYPEGHVFGQSFTEKTIYEIDEKTAVPTLLAVSQNVPGFCQALQDMVEGEICHMVIPYYVGYGSNSSSTYSNIPDYSTLIFDVKLVKVYARGENTSWR